MLSSQLAPQEMRKESRRLIKNISRRISRIEGLGESTPLYAVNLYRDLEKTIPKRLTELSDKDLRTLYRDLRYINSLKSSTVKGALQAQQKFEPIKAKLSVLSKETQDKFWSIYGRLYEKTGGEMEKFKYELFETNIDYIYSGSSVDDAFEEIINEYNASLEDEDTDEEVRISFTNKLKNLRRKP